VLAAPQPARANQNGPQKILKNLKKSLAMPKRTDKTAANRYQLGEETTL
jgi:hypothetical protein